MKILVVADSSSNIFEIEDLNYKNVPLKIISDTKEYVDIPGLDINQMVEEMYKSKEKFKTSCPNVFEWQQAFEGESNIFAITITSKLSGSYFSALSAAKNYEDKNVNIHVIDSLSTGPEMELIIEKLRELSNESEEFSQIKDEIDKYTEKTNLIFSLESLNNLAKNGRVNPAVAKIAGVLGIRIVGKAENGVLKPLHKCRGAKKTIETLKNEMREMGFNGGKVRIAHCQNEDGALELKNKILEIYPDSDVKITNCTALCSFYAEKGGILVGFES